MSTQPEPLRLADSIRCAITGCNCDFNKASDHLRRLHEVNADLLAALKELMSEGSETFPDTIEAAHAAIAKAEGRAA